MLYRINFFIIILFFCFPMILRAASLPERLAGYILLQVEENGEAWYVDTKDFSRYFLGRPDDAFRIMRERGIGITNNDLNKIPIGLGSTSGGDSDGDGLSDIFEDSVMTDKNKKDTDGDGFDDFHEIQNGFNPLGPGNILNDILFSQKNKGKIFLQVENYGEAWYVDPRENKRYFLGRPDDAFRIMREKGMGITNNDLSEILSRTPSFFLFDLEQDLHKLINKERRDRGIKELVWSDDLAKVARRHSSDLARENENFTGFGLSCDYPLIHHEGFNFGIYNSERLASEKIYYFSKAGENIALLSGVSHIISFWEGDNIEQEVERCQDVRSVWDKDIKDILDGDISEDEKLKILKSEIQKREIEFKKSKPVNIVDSVWTTKDILAQRTVEGWMNSPGHRKNILTEDFNESGMGVAYVNGYFISTQVFIERAECGFNNGPCCAKEGYYPYCYIPLECNMKNICQ